MASTLRARLERIRKTPPKPAAVSGVSPENAPSAAGADAVSPGGALPTGNAPETAVPHGFAGWEEAGYGVLRRTLSLSPALPLPSVLPRFLPILLPDLDGAAGRPCPGNLLFFDLETTGLSGGAGTVAFLAAFGRFVSDNGSPAFTRLEITQFLLLDYPGESDFIDNILTFLKKYDPGNAVSSGPEIFLTTYNGKSFDSQVLKTRCLMNGRTPPVLPQLDLLHPARRMWKRVLPNCSQATVEGLVLDIDRADDIPGSLAPEIWFDFLRSRGNGTAARRLLGICDHNVKDIAGLAALFTAFTEIAGNPVDAARRFRCDTENLAMIFRRRARCREPAGLRSKPELNQYNWLRRPAGGYASGPLFEDEAGADPVLKSAAAVLLDSAAEHYPQSCLRLGFDLFRAGRYGEGRTALSRLAEADGAEWRTPVSAVLRALALRALAADAETRLKKPGTALAYCMAALGGGAPADEEAPGPVERRVPEDMALPDGLRESLEKRRRRLAAR